VERKRLDIFTRFLDPAGIEPAAVRTSELTVMIIQLVASRRGVAALPSWALMEYTARGDVVARPFGENGMWAYLVCRDADCG
jgi:LysR family transcriptional regulator, regulator for metE and metH